MASYAKELNTAEVAYAAIKEVSNTDNINEHDGLPTEFQSQNSGPLSKILQLMEEDNLNEINLWLLTVNIIFKIGACFSR